MFIPFEKWHGCKNDFLVTWITPNEGDIFLDVLKRKAPFLCSKAGDGIGADGILVLHHGRKDDPYADKLTIINADGSIAKNCGNGLRCAAASILWRIGGVTKDVPDSLELDVEGQKIICRLMEGASSSLEVSYFAVEMPSIKLNKELSWNDEARKECEDLLNNHKIKFDQIHLCEIGNPHLVVMCSAWDIEKWMPFAKEAQSVRKGDGINVHFVNALTVTAKDETSTKNVLGEALVELHKVWVWERGVGPTQACGTGACAVAASIYQEGFTERDGWIGIDMPGGRLFVKQDEEGGTVQLAGPTEFVFEGQIEI